MSITRLTVFYGQIGMTSNHFDEIKKCYPVTKVSPNGEWEYKIEYVQGCGGYNLVYQWRHIKDDLNDKWHKRPYLYFLANYADGNMDGYCTMEWKSNEPATLVFQSGFGNFDADVFDRLEIVLCLRATDPDPETLLLPHEMILDPIKKPTDTNTNTNTYSSYGTQTELSTVTSVTTFSTTSTATMK